MTNGRRHFLAALGGAGIGGLLLGLLEVGLLAARGGLTLDGPDLARMAAVGLIGGATAGLTAGLLAAPLAVWLRRRPRPRAALAALATLGALSAAALDAWYLVGLYPWAHTALKGGALLGAVGAGGLLWPITRGPLGTGVTVALLAASPLLPTIVGDGLRFSQTLRRADTLAARVVDPWLQTPEGAAMPPCTVGWPPRVAPPVGAPRASAVIFVSIDAFRGDLAGPRLAQTLPKSAPWLAKMVRFDRAYAAAVRTNESAFAFLTGRWPHRSRFDYVGIDANENYKIFETAPALTDTAAWKQRHLAPVRDTEPTLASTLTAAGYDTMALISYIFFQPQLGITRGFAHHDDGAYRQHNRDNKGVTGPALTDAALAYLDAAPPKFFLWFHNMDPHAPYVPFAGTEKGESMKVRYFSELQRTDAELARLFARLDAQSRWDHTVVIVAADHGEEFRDHGGLFHGTSVYDEQARVPLLIWAPGAQARAISTPVSLIDVAPTVLELVGVPAAGPLDGVSLAPALFGGPVPPHPVLSVSTLNGYRAAVVDGQHKLIVDRDQQTVELYDLRADPAERANRVDIDSAQVQALTCRLLASGVMGRALTPPPPAP